MFNKKLHLNFGQVTSVALFKMQSSMYSFTQLSQNKCLHGSSLDKTVFLIHIEHMASLEENLSCLISFE